MRSLAIVATAALIVAAPSGFVHAVPMPKNNHPKPSPPVANTVCQVYDPDTGIYFTRQTTIEECKKGAEANPFTKVNFAKKRDLAVGIDPGLPLPQLAATNTPDVGIDLAPVPTEGLPLPQPTVTIGSNTGTVVPRGDDRGSGPSRNGGL